MLAVYIAYSCKEDEPLPPSITTTPVSALSATSAVSGGTVIDVGSSPLLNLGLCWSTSSEPTIADMFTTESLAELSFSSKLTQLTPSTRYYLRAYATNSSGTAYGNQLTLQTPNDILLTKDDCILSGGSIISTFDGGHIVYGFIYKEYPQYDWIPYIIKLDAEDNRIWETEVSVNISASLPLEQYKSIMEIKDHRIVFCYKSYVVMIDMNGTVLWKLEYKTEERYCCFSVVESDEDNLFVLASDELQTSLLKVSLDGRLLWDKVVKDGSDVNTNYGYLLRKLINGNYILAGHSNVDMHWRIWLAEINPTGDIIKENIYLDTYELSFCRDMITTKDGGLIIAGISMGDKNETYARVLKLDSQHNLSWEKIYSWDYFKNNANAIIQDSNGDYVFCGTQGYQQVSAVLVKLNKDGNELWKRTYWPQDELDYRWYLGDLLQLSNGGYLLVGNKSDLWGEAMPEGIWVKKVDQSGY